MDPEDEEILVTTLFSATVAFHCLVFDPKLNVFWVLGRMLPDMTTFPDAGDNERSPLDEEMLVTTLFSATVAFHCLEFDPMLKEFCVLGRILPAMTTFPDAGVTKRSPLGERISLHVTMSVLMSIPFFDVLGIFVTT
jgi:hypothetical protein